jgi:flagellar biosynthesis protein FliR
LRSANKADESKQQAIREYHLIKELHNGTRDKYAHYLQLAGWSIIFAITCSTLVIIVAIASPDLETFTRRAPIVILLALAILFFILSLSVMLVLYDRSRKVHRFSDYKADFVKKWGPVID